MRRVILLTLIDIKLVVRTMKIHAYIPPLAAIAGFLVWKFGGQAVHLSMAAIVIAFSLIFSTQYTRTGNELALYCVLPFPKRELVAAKNLSSVCCVAGLTGATLLVVAALLGIDRSSIGNGAAIILFVSMVQASVGNLVSSKSLATEITHYSLARQYIQALAAIAAFAIFILLERRIGLRLAVITCLVLCVAFYIPVFARTCKTLDSACQSLLEEE